MTDVIVEMGWRHDDRGYWMWLDGPRKMEVGPFETKAEAEQIIEAMKKKSVQGGGIELPLGAKH